MWARLTYISAQLRFQKTFIVNNLAAAVYLSRNDMSVESSRNVV